MFLHEPEGYDCPFCRVVRSDFDAKNWSTEDDVVLRTDRVTAWVSPAWWPNNPGHVMIVPNAHYENLFVLPADEAAAIHVAAQRLARAMKAMYLCDGISTRQHNEPAGNQEIWHYHLHLFPRYHNDDLYERSAERRRVSLEERRPYAERLRVYLQANP